MKKERTPEERLEAARVPREEWMYELPEGWKWVRLGGIAEIIMGQSPSGDQTTTNPSDTPLIGGASDIVANGLQAHKYTMKPTKLSQAGDIVFCIRATLGRPVFADGEYCLGRGVAAARCETSVVNGKYLRYFIDSSEQYFYDHAAGTTFLQITGKVIKNVPVPLPPLAEQKKIVAQLETYFAKLDAAEEKIDAADEQFAVQKNALLHAAFSGTLTEKWREEEGTSRSDWKRQAFLEVPREERPYDLPKKWAWVYAKDLFDIQSSKRVHKSDWKNEGVPFYRTRELVKLSEDGFVDNELFISQELYETNRNQYGVPEKGDLLVSGVGTIGVPYLVKGTKPFYFKDGNILWFKRRSDVNSLYVFYLYKSLFMNQQIHGMSAGTTVDTYTIVNAKRTKIPLPPLPEQREIVRRLDGLLDRVERARGAVDAARARVRDLRAALLARAFRGEL